MSNISNTINAECDALILLIRRAKSAHWHSDQLRLLRAAVNRGKKAIDTLESEKNNMEVGELVAAEASA